MPTPTYIPLATVTLSAAAASITFSSVSQAYRDLIIVAEVERTSTAAGEYVYQFNNDGNNNYSWVTMRGGASSNIISSAQGAINSIRPVTGVGEVNGIPNTTILQVFDYSQTNKHKSGVLMNGNPNGLTTISSVQTHAFRYASNTAISTINIVRGGGEFAIGTSVTIYGIEG